MPLPAALYAVPDVPVSRRKPQATALKANAQTAHDRESRLKRKIESVNAVLDEIDSRQAALAAQIKELSRRKASLCNRAEKITDRILTLMAEAHVDKVSGVRVTFTARPCPASVVIDDEALLSRDYFREKLVSTVDKIQIKCDLAKGLDVPGTHLESRITLVRK